MNNDASCDPTGDDSTAKHVVRTTAEAINAQVWCSKDLAPIIIERAGQRYIFTWRDSTEEFRNTQRDALLLWGFFKLATRCIGDVQPGEVEAWTAAGCTVLLDCEVETPPDFEIAAGE